MKKIILLFNSLLIAVVIFTYSGCASSKEATKEQMTHEYIKEYKGITKDQIFDRTMRWISQNFKSAKSVIDYQDKSSGTIIAKGIIPNVNLGGIYDANLSFTLTFDAKENKARFVYDNLIPIDPSSGEELTGMTNFERVHQKANAEFDKITDSISKAIMTNSDF